jgi:hypothetical protein
VGLLRLRAGRITGAASPGTLPLAQLLASAQKLSPKALEAVATQQAAGASDLAIGELLVRDGHVDAESAQEAMKQQVALAVRELVHWTEGEFAFNHEGDVAPASSRISVDLDPQAVLLRVAKEMDGPSRDFSDEVKP